MTRLPHHARHIDGAQRYGLTPASGTPCPRWLAGGRCTSPRDCACQQFHHLLDHAQLWARPNGTTVLIGEPYSVGPGELATFSALCDDLGLNVVVTGMSPWNTGATVAVEVTRR